MGRIPEAQRVCNCAGLVTLKDAPSRGLIATLRGDTVTVLLRVIRDGLGRPRRLERSQDHDTPKLATLVTSCRRSGHSAWVSEGVAGTKGVLGRGEFGVGWSKGLERDCGNRKGVREAG